MVLEGFLKNMDNSAGRNMIYTLMNFLKPHLKVCEGYVRLYNVGGRSKRCGHARQIHGIVIPDPYAPPTTPNVGQKIKAGCGRSSAKPESSTDSNSQSPTYFLRKKQRCYDFDSLESELEESSYAAIVATKHFVPDFVLMSARTPNGKDPLVLLTVSFKIGIGFAARAETELRYEMLPVVMEQNETLGLILSSGTALLIKMFRDKITKEVKTSHMPEYTFLAKDGSFDFGSFDKMCVDLIHHCHLVWNACCND